MRDLLKGMGKKSYCSVRKDCSSAEPFNPWDN